MPKVFISYRRGDTGEVARRLGHELKDDLRLESVFLDSHDVWGGDDWRAVLDDRIRGSDAVVALVGDRWAGGDDGRRIFQADDVVRWELRRTLETGRGLVPTMVDGARLPERLPHDIAALKGANWIDLDPADSLLRYLELLGDLFYKTIRNEGDVVIISDGTDEAQVHVRKLAAMLKGGELVEEGRDLVRAATRGFAAVTLGDAAKNWPDVIVLQGLDRTSPELQARERGVRRNRARVVTISATTVAAAFMAGRASATPEQLLRGGADTGPELLVPDPPPTAVVPPAPGAGQQGSSTPGDQASPTEAASSQDASVGSSVDLGGKATRRSPMEWWRALPIGAKASTLLGTVAAVVVALQIIQPPPITLAGEWDVTDFVFEPSGDQTSNVTLTGGRMLFEPTPDCEQEPCELVVTDGPPLLMGILMRPVEGASRYVGQEANVVPVCDGDVAPPEVTETTLTATQGTGSTLTFVITSALTEPWGGCDPFSSQYTATATRA